MIPILMTSKANCHRKTHRITVPIEVIIANQTYRVLDWSTQGFKVNLPENNMKIGEQVAIMIILPTEESSILLKAEVILRSVNHENYGFEIVKLNEKNHRVLRHYATLSIDANNSHIDDLSADLFMANVASPIRESISLSEKEHKEVHKSFLKRALFYLVFGVILFCFIVVTFIYNYIILYESSGLVAGSAKYYSAPKEGLLKAVYVSVEQKVRKNQLLFEMDVKTEENLLKNFLAQQSLLKKQLEQAENSLFSISKVREEKIVQMQVADKREKDFLQTSYHVQIDTYKRAKYLYEEHLIAAKKYMDIENQYLAFISRYNDIVLHNKSIGANKNKLLAEQGFNKSQDQMIALQKTVDKLHVDIQMNELEITRLKEQIESSKVTAQEDAIVHNIFYKSNTYLKYAENILTLETEQKPYILSKILSSEIVNIHLGEPCILYSQREKKSYRAHIVGIGYSSAEGFTTNTAEISQNEIPVRINFDDSRLRFHLNEYFEVYLINDSLIATQFLRLLPQDLIKL